MLKLLNQESIFRPVSPQRLGQPCQPKPGPCVTYIHSNGTKKPSSVSPDKEPTSSPSQSTGYKQKRQRKKKMQSSRYPHSSSHQASLVASFIVPTPGIPSLRGCFKNPSPSWSKASQTQVGVRFRPPIRQTPLRHLHQSAPWLLSKTPAIFFLLLYTTVTYRVHGKPVTNCSRAPMRHPSSCIGLAV